MTVSKVIYDALLMQSHDIERNIWNMQLPQILEIQNKKLAIHKVLSLFVAPQLCDNEFNLFIDIEFINNSGNYEHQRLIFDRWT